MSNKSQNNKFNNKEKKASTKEEYVSWIDHCLYGEMILDVPVKKWIDIYEVYWKYQLSPVEKDGLKSCFLTIIKQAFLKEYPYPKYANYDIIKDRLADFIPAANYIFKGAFEAIKLSYNGELCPVDIFLPEFNQVLPLAFGDYITEKKKYEDEVVKCLYEEKILDGQIEILVKNFNIRQKIDKDFLKDRSLDVIKRAFLQKYKFPSLANRIKERLPEFISAVREVLTIVEFYFVKSTENGTQEFDCALKLAFDWYTEENSLEKVISEKLIELQKNVCELTKISDPQINLKLSDLDWNGVRDEIRKVNLKDYPFTQYEEGEILNNRSNMKSDALYYCNMTYMAWGNMSYAQRLVRSCSKFFDYGDYVSIIDQSIMQLWTKKSDPMSKDGTIYKNLCSEQLIGAVTTTIMNTFTQEQRKRAKIVKGIELDHGNDEDGSGIESLPGQDLTAERDYFVEKERKELWEIIKSLTNSLSKNLFTTRVYRDIIILGILFPTYGDKEIAILIRGNNPEHYDSSNVTVHRHNACRAILIKFFNKPQHLINIKEIDEDFDLKSYLNPSKKEDSEMEEEDKKRRHALFNELKKILSGLKGFYDQEPEEFRKYFEVNYGYCENSSNVND